MFWGSLGLYYLGALAVLGLFEECSVGGRWDGCWEGRQQHSQSPLAPQPALAKGLEGDGVHGAPSLALPQPLLGGDAVSWGGGCHLLPPPPKQPLTSQAPNFIPLPTVRHHLLITHNCSMLQIEGV